MTVFDAKASTYDDFCRTPIGHYVDVVEHDIIRALANPKPGEIAVDLGCGTGAYTLWLAEMGLSVHGVDISAAMLQVARQKRHDEVNPAFVQADLTNLPFDDDTFDLAICNVVLEFVTDSASVLREAHRILKPGGRMVVGFVGRNSPWGAKYTRRGQTDPTSVYSSAHFYSYSEAVGIGTGVLSGVTFGLYVGPEEFVDDVSAWELERRRVVLQKEQGAGYFVICWGKDPTVRP